MKKEEYKNMTVGEIVSNDFRTAEIFKKAGIDFCCGGNQSMDEACMEKKIDIRVLELKLEELEQTEPNPSQNFKEWNLDFLCDYLVNTHHKTVMKLLPQLTFYTQKIADVHGDHHPELIEIAELFGQINIELQQHLRKEEEVLFPAIKEAMRTHSEDAKQAIISEITRMRDEHEFAGGAMDRINRLSINYMVPPDACNTYQVAFKMLSAFEDDLHIHVHLENNILYPKALELAKSGL